MSARDDKGQVWTGFIWTPIQIRFQTLDPDSTWIQRVWKSWIHIQIRRIYKSRSNIDFFIIENLQLSFNLTTHVNQQIKLNKFNSRNLAIKSSIHIKKPNKFLIIRKITEEFCNENLIKMRKSQEQKPRIWTIRSSCKW